MIEKSQPSSNSRGSSATALEHCSGTGQAVIPNYLNKVAIDETKRFQAIKSEH